MIIKNDVQLHNFQENLRVILKAKNITQETLAKYLGCARSTISGWVTGVNVMTKGDCYSVMYLMRDEFGYTDYDILRSLEKKLYIEKKVSCRLSDKES